MAIFFPVWGWEKELYGHGLLNKKWASLHSKLKYVFISKTSEGKDPDTVPINLDKVVPSSPFKTIYLKTRKNNRKFNWLTRFHLFQSSSDHHSFPGWLCILSKRLRFVGVVKHVRQWLRKMSTNPQVKSLSSTKLCIHEIKDNQIKIKSK